MSCIKRIEIKPVSSLALSKVFNRIPAVHFLPRCITVTGIKIKE